MKQYSRLTQDGNVRDVNINKNTDMDRTSKIICQKVHEDDVTMTSLLVSDKVTWQFVHGGPFKVAAKFYHVWQNSKEIEEPPHRAYLRPRKPSLGRV